MNMIFNRELFTPQEIKEMYPASEEGLEAKKLNDKEKEAITMLQNAGEHVKPSDSDKNRIFSRLRHIFD